MGSHFKVRTTKTGHYFTHGTLSSETQFIWIALHGYGQLGKYFIQKFEFLDPSKHFVIAPEGLNRFYFEGVNERPVASWMTREDRLDEIADFTLFLESLRQKIGWEKFSPPLGEVGWGNAKLIFFGFSQGGTTLIRWLHNNMPRVDHLIIWAGGVPEDIDYTFRKEYFSQIPCHYFLGDQDQYLTFEQFEERKHLAHMVGIDLQVRYYKGDHRVDGDVLAEWVGEVLENSA